MSETKTMGDVYNDAWDECAAKHNWTLVHGADRPAWAKGCDEVAAAAVIAAHEAQRTSAIGPEDYEVCEQCGKTRYEHDVPAPACPDFWGTQRYALPDLDAVIARAIAEHEAQRPAWPAMRPMSDPPELEKWAVLAARRSIVGDGVVFEERDWRICSKKTDYLGWWPLPEVPHGN